MRSRYRKIANLSLQKRIIALFFICIIVPVFSLGLVAYAYSSDIIHRKLIDYNVDLMGEMAQTIELRMDAIDYMTVAMFTNDVLQENVHRLGKGYDSLVKRTQAILEVEKVLIQGSAAYDGVVGVGLLGNNIEIRTSITVPSLQLNEAERALVDAGKGKCVWITSLNGQRRLACARVLYSLTNQMPMGYLVVAYDHQAFVRILKSKEYFKDGAVYLIGGDNGIIAGREAFNVGTPLEVAGEYLSDAAEGRIVNGQYIVTRNIAGTVWRLVSVVPTVHFEREIRSLRAWIFTLTPIMALLSFLLACKISKQMLNPLKMLADTMQTVGQGNLEERWEYPYRNEIGVIGTEFNRMLAQINQLMKDSLEQQHLYHDAEIRALRMQINPHFIYNTLDSIKWMAGMNGNDEMVQVVSALSDYMRSTIYGPAAVALRDEIENTRNYLFIQQFRYGDQLKCHVDMADDILDYPVPRLILQPLVENAIIHGTSKKIGIGHIDLSGVKTDNGIELCVRDDGPGMSRERAQQVLSCSNEAGGRDTIGLYNVHRRLELLYGKGYGLEISCTPGCGTIVKVRIPTNVKLKIE